MLITDFNPFESLIFRPDICFLTGASLTDETRQLIPVFPTWLIERYHLEEASIMMLDGNRMMYKDMLLPASKSVANAVSDLDAITQKAFEEGYDSIVQLPELILFQWMIRVMYGVLYQDFSYAISQQEKRRKEFIVSPLLRRKYKNLRLMLQSLIRPVIFDGFSPWSIKLYRVNISKDILNYKDETRKLNFCFGMNGFAIAACLQDNGEISAFNQDVFEKIGGATLHPAQFEELYGRFMYANYLLYEIPDYVISEQGDSLIFRMPEDPYKGGPHFKEWEDKVYSQVLANAWQPWGVPIKEIYMYPNSPISYLIDEFTDEFISPDQIKLQY
ncbi:hypothetical protein [Arachidicoccus sp.]|uniref:hypothetical protein n=1 Tax=Arachidicoccus sp. TaxID=1872624 RepID=UPI003D1AC571